MNKKEILEVLKKQNIKSFTAFIMNQIESFLSDDCKYDLHVLEKGFCIRSKIDDINNGTYLEAVVSFSEKQKTNSLVLTKKEYTPFYELRNGFREKVSLDVFTTAYSYVVSQDDRILYSSWYSDDNKYATSDINHELTRDELLKVFSDTSPEYENGIIIYPPKSSYQPFHNVFERYNDTNVYREYGRNPMRGEYSYIGITFDNSQIGDIKLLPESYGTVYSSNGSLKESDTNSVVRMIDEIYRKHNHDGNFDLDSFYEEYNDTLFEPRKIK